MDESTYLSRAFSDQGVRLRLRKEPRAMMGYVTKILTTSQKLMQNLVGLNDSSRTPLQIQAYQTLHLQLVQTQTSTPTLIQTTSHNLLQSVIALLANRTTMTGKINIQVNRRLATSPITLSHNTPSDNQALVVCQACHSSSQIPLG